MCLGPGPIPIGVTISKTIRREVLKVALGPSATEADAHTFASLRSLQPCVLPFVLSRAALLTRPCPAQPLLLTADSAGSSIFLSPIGVTIAAARRARWPSAAVPQAHIHLNLEDTPSGSPQTKFGRFVTVL